MNYNFPFLLELGTVGCFLQVGGTRRTFFMAEPLLKNNFAIYLDKKAAVLYNFVTTTLEQTHIKC